MAIQRKTVWGGPPSNLHRRSEAVRRAGPFGPAVLGLAITILSITPLWAQSGARLSDSLRKHVASKSTAPVDVIVHGSAAEIEALAARHGVAIKKRLDDGGVLRVSAAQIDALGAAVDHLSRDATVSSFMSVTNSAIGADQVWAGIAGLPGITGAGIGIALIDSGIWAEHRSLAGRVVFAKDFVSNAPARSTRDEYGHGTHIAGIIAGDSPYPQDSSYQTPFRGVAPGANLISLRVIGADGTGLVSDVIEAIEWAIRNRHRYNIRVINLSLGHPPEESYRDDPMCEAVERAIHAGIVVVAAAGNRGKDAEGRSVHVTIDSPATDPYVITVAALNTKGTVRRSDDELTTYSSKGPTLDGVIKPDIAAPGNKIVSAEALESSIVADYPGLHASGSGADAYLTLSGTSMAAGVVSGAVALVLEANDKLNPAQVKAALQYSASFMPEVGLLGAGAGSLNVVGSVNVTLKGSELSAGEAQSFESWKRPIYLDRQVKSSKVVWGGGAIWDHRVVGKCVDCDIDRIIWSQRIIWSNRTIWDDRIVTRDCFECDIDRIIWGDQILWGE
jgi:serine protease AprX